MSHKHTETFRRNLATLCAGYGGVTRAAKNAGLTREYLSNVIHGKVTPSLDIACRIADATGKSLSDLLYTEIPAGSPADQRKAVSRAS